ncbi:MAG TPA: tetratricopeptide repeat protein [Vicinamibacteria bacterium]|nr:tetratricopeptide repeat protein [Vicinamibacteria bacterium]
MQRRAVLLAAFFLSGLAALVFEMIWTRLLLLHFGATATAVGVVLSAFMGGMAIGSALAGRRFIARLDPVMTFVVLEAFVGLYALVTPALIGKAEQALLAIAAILPATIAMGASLPVLVRALSEDRAAVRVGLLYASNTAGAVLGPVLAVFWFFPLFGLSRTLFVGAGLEIVACGLLLVFGMRRGGTPSAAAPLRSGAPPVVLVAVAVSGASAMVYEVAWSRTLSMVYGSSVYGVSIMLSTFLFGIALGSATAAAYLRRRPRGENDRLRLAKALVASAGFAFLSLVIARSLPFLFLNLYTSFDGREGTLFASQFVIAGLLMLPCTFALGATLPLAIDATRATDDEGATVPHVYGANLLGSSAGALLASAFLLGNLGVEFSTRAAAIAALAMALWLLFRSRRSSVPTTAVAGSLVLVILALDPSGARALKSFGVYSGARTYATYELGQLRNIVAAHELVFYRDGATATVSVQKIERFRLLKINGKTDASNGPGDMQTQLLMGHLPFLARPARRVAVIGWGSGYTVDAVLQHAVEQVDAFEIEPAVVEASRFFEPENGAPLSDERVRLVLGDARRELARGGEPYDFIISEPSNPWLTGVANLFTHDFFEQAARRLAEDGVFCQWFHLYGMSEASTRSLLSSFRAVFPHVTVFQDRDLVVLGSRSPIRLSMERLQALYDDEAIRERLAAANFNYPADILAGMTLDAKGAEAFTRGATMNTDDNMLIELAAPRSLYRDDVAEILAAMQARPPDVLAHVSDMTSEAGTRLELAASYFTSGKLDAALEQAERAVSVEPSFQAEKLRGQILQRLGRSDEARVALESALKAGGDQVERRFVEAMLRSLGS